MLLRYANKVLNMDFIVSYTYTPSKGQGETTLTLMLSTSQGDGAQTLVHIKGEEADGLWAKLCAESSG